MSFAKSTDYPSYDLINTFLNLIRKPYYFCKWEISTFLTHMKIPSYYSKKVLSATSAPHLGNSESDHC